MNIFNNLKNKIIFRFLFFSLNVICHRYSLPAIAKAMAICVAYGNKVMDTHLPLPVGSGDKYDLDSRVQCGRSMIEMLGVLAIIAVLSVGGIAGYSKAMLMWRSNIQRNMIAEFIASAIKLRGNLIRQNNKYSQFENISAALAAMGDIPEGVSVSGGHFVTKDNMTVSVRYGFQTWTNGGELRYSMVFNYQKGNDFTPTISDFCRNLIIAAKQTVEEINLIAYWGTNSNNNQGWSGKLLYTGQTLKQATLSEINSKCQDPFKEAGGATFELLLIPY